MQKQGLLKMGEALDPTARPSRLSTLAHFCVVLLLALSFVTGVLIWWGQSVQLRAAETPAWLRPCVLLHGILNPFLCVLFGYLCCHHIRFGWQLKANLVTGVTMELLFAGLIVSGVGLYYAGSTTSREVFEFAHRVIGLLMPVGLVTHWLAGVRWAKKSGLSLSQTQSASLSKPRKQP